LRFWLKSTALFVNIGCEDLQCENDTIAHSELPMINSAKKNGRNFMESTISKHDGGYLLGQSLLSFPSLPKMPPAHQQRLVLLTVRFGHGEKGYEGRR
jgi:hypothetical protein